MHEACMQGASMVIFNLMSEIVQKADGLDTCCVVRTSSDLFSSQNDSLPVPGMASLAIHIFARPGNGHSRFISGLALFSRCYVVG